ncbi:MAG TPA: glycosyltransferase family A protein, partial [Saprospiraceae bacterium]|nr:glycosyltransferase family A protein [Saprospiraceae bacterium]HQW57303.1 glycosyltransferase family A protein [Saprospiraceae bacterium]
MTLPTVSIIIPYYNAEKTLQRAIDSALAQTYPAIEILLVDNNSTDQSAQIAAQNELRHSGKIKLSIESKSGSNFARNTGLKNAQGDWLQFLDADDEILPEKINHQLELMQLYPECDVIYACYSEVIPHENKNRVRIYTRRQV